jgi:hypothetical protein
MAEYDFCGLVESAQVFAEAAATAERAARAVRRLRADDSRARARLQVDLAGLDQRLRHHAGELDRTSRLLARAASDVTDVDRRIAADTRTSPTLARPTWHPGAGLRR